MIFRNNATLWPQTTATHRLERPPTRSRVRTAGSPHGIALAVFLVGTNACSGSPAAEDASPRAHLRIELETLEEPPESSEFRIWLEVDQGPTPYDSFQLNLMAEAPDLWISWVESFSLDSPTLPPLTGDATVRDPYDFGLGESRASHHFVFDEESGGYKSEGNALRPATRPPFTIPPGTHTVQLSYIVKDEEVQAVEEHMGWEAARHVVGPTYRLHVPPPT